MAVASQDIGATIAYLRKREGMTQRALAERLKVTDKAVSRWERGIGMPDQSLLAGLADALGVDIESILSGEHASVGEKWVGVVLLEYACGPGPSLLLFDRPVLLLQLGYLMLAGLDEVLLVGKAAAISDAERIVGELPDMGVSFSSIELRGEDTAGDMLVGGLASAFGGSGKFDALCRKLGGVLVIDGLDFIYGKDLTRALKRQIVEADVPTRLYTYGGVPLHAFFIPAWAGTAGNRISLSDGEFGTASLGRGVVAFPVESPQDALDASLLISTIARHEPEPFMDLESIARARSLVGS